MNCTASAMQPIELDGVLLVMRSLCCGLKRFDIPQTMNSAIVYVTDDAVSNG